MVSLNDEKASLEAGNNILFKYSQRRRIARRNKFLFAIALLIGTIAFYLLFGAIVLCFYADATLLALITNPSFSHRLNILRNQWVNTKGDMEELRALNVVAVVDYRSRERSSILECYLRRNLVQYGGLLDEVVFIPATSDEQHLEWLYETVNRSDSYSISQSLPTAVEANNLHIKIDGDVVYIEDNVIPNMVKTKLQHPETNIISANVIHQPAVAEYHRRTGMLRSPMLLDPESLSRGSRPSSEQNWLSQAQQHDSFLDHLERGELQPYKFPLWINPPGEISGAFIILPNGNNTTTNPSGKKSVLINGKGVVSHYDTAAGEEGLDATDILARYEQYAAEHICFDD